MRRLFIGCIGQDQISLADSLMDLACYRFGGRSLALAAEWQRDWARTETAAAITEVMKEHAAGSGIAFMWEQQLLNTPIPSAAT